MSERPPVHGRAFLICSVSSADFRERFQYSKGKGCVRPLRVLHRCGITIPGPGRGPSIVPLPRKRFASSATGGALPLSLHDFNQPAAAPHFCLRQNGKAPKEKDTSYRMGKVQGSRQDPAKRSWWEGEEKVRPAYEKSPKAFFIALGLFLNLERATRLELASRYPTNRLRRFAGTLPHL